METEVAIDEKGHAMITGVEPGTYTLVIEGKGFRSATKKIEKKHFKSNDTLIVEMSPIWEFEGAESLSFSQNAVGTYWQAGGLNSVATRASIKLGAKYKRGKRNWDTDLDIDYGVVKNGKYKWIKNEDQVNLSSKYGYKFTDNLLLTALLDVKSQIHNTYKVTKEGSRGDLAAGFLSPAFINLGSGIDYKYKKAGLSVYYSPLNSKITIVKDTSLLSAYLPAELASEGQTSRYELGSYLNVKYKKEILKNVTLQTKADFFTNHLKNFGSIDVNWETLMAFKVNKYLTANILTHLIYDEDIQFVIKDADGNPLQNPITGEATGKKGPRTQFREALNIGFLHKF